MHTCCFAIRNPKVTKQNIYCLKMSQAGKKKGLNWISEEIELLLNEVEKILPRGGNEWETVTKNYNIARLNPLI